MIQINNRLDSRIASNFPNDPDGHLCITTATKKLNLQLAFLSIDSDYFAEVDPDTRHIELNHLPEQPLLAVMKSLYGHQLKVMSISELMEIYPIILQLKISDYQQNICRQILQKPQLLQSLDMVEFSFRFSLLLKQVKALHFANRLRLLEESKNYLQLSKISNITFNTLLLEFIEVEKDTDTVVNNVMENYFDRKAIKAVTYLQSAGLAKLMAIWQKFHHVKCAESPTTVIKSACISHHRQKSSARKTNIDKKKKQIEELEKQLANKNGIIIELENEISEIKKQRQMLFSIDTTEDDDEMTFQKRIKWKQGSNWISDSNELEYERPKRLNGQPKQIKSMQRVNSKKKK